MIFHIYSLNSNSFHVYIQLSKYFSIWIIFPRIKLTVIISSSCRHACVHQVILIHVWFPKQTLIGWALSHGGRTHTHTQPDKGPLTRRSIIKTDSWGSLVSMCLVTLRCRHTHALTHGSPPQCAHTSQHGTATCSHEEHTLRLVTQGSLLLSPHNGLHQLWCQ